MKYLALLLIPISLFAEVKTTGSLVINGTFNDGTNGWTTSGEAVRINDCCPGGHDLEFGGSGGSIEQSFNLINDSITQTMLDQNSISLNSSVEIQNGECQAVGCWGGSGPVDPFTTSTQSNSSGSNTHISGGYSQESTTTYQSGSSSNTTTNSTTNNSTSNAASRNPVSTASAPSMQTYSQRSCIIGLTGGFSVIGFSGSLGSYKHGS